MKMILYKLIRPIIMFFYRIIWRLRNRHNLTNINSRHINKVKVGKYTYGDINIIHTYGSKNEFLKIGNFCSIAPKVSFILGGEHPYKGISTYPFKVKVLSESREAISKGNIVVNDDVWIGHGATILSGVTVGQGSIIAAKSVVVKDIPPYSIVGGNPAKIIKYRFSNEIIEKLQLLNFEKLDVNKINLENIELLYQDLVISNYDKIINEFFSNTFEA